jgi:hypothetical protein
MVYVSPPSDGVFDHGRLTFLESYLWDKPPHPGQLIEWDTSWRMEEMPVLPRLKMFLHVLNNDGEVVAGDDRESMNFGSLNAGDFLWQISSLVLPQNLAPGQYQIEIGWYNPDTGERLKLADGSDRYLLNPIKVTSP